MTLKERLEQGSYEVDATKVAEAIVKSPLWMVLLAGGGRSLQRPDQQKLCS